MFFTIWNNETTIRFHIELVDVAETDALNESFDFLNISNIPLFDPEQVPECVEKNIDFELPYREKRQFQT